MQTKESPRSGSVFVTSSRARDLAILGAFLALTLAAAPWLRVYYRITSFELELTRISPEGDRSAVPLPAELNFSEYWNRKPEDLLPRVEGSFRRVAEERLDQEAPGTRYELTIHYSFNSPNRDRSQTWQVP